MYTLRKCISRFPVSDNVGQVNRFNPFHKQPFHLILPTSGFTSVVLAVRWLRAYLQFCKALRRYKQNA